MLTVREHMILDFEDQTYRHIGVKEQHIRELFGVTPTHYYQELNRLIDRVEAYTHKPLLTQRIRARRTTRTRGNHGAAALTHWSLGEHQKDQAA